METNKIYYESCMQTMARMPDNFVDCVMTSVPYYGLRSYDTEPQLWLGDPECDHTWETIVTKRPNAAGGKDSGQIAYKEDAGAHYVEYHKRETTSQMCQTCGCWLGELGQEPNHLMYIEHLVVVFLEVHRILKKTGTCFVNIDDSNVGTGGDYGTGSKGKIYPRLTPDDGRYERLKNIKRLGLKAKSMMGIPERFSTAMLDLVGFIKRNNIAWHKASVQPRSALDAFTPDFEPIYFFTKTGKYYFETQYERAKSEAFQKRSEKIVRPGSGRSVPYNRAGDRKDGMRIMRTVQSINTANGDSRDVEHYAAYPVALAARYLKAGCPEKVCVWCGTPSGVTESRTWLCKCNKPLEFEPGLVYDPFAGTGTTMVAAENLNCRWIGSELSADYSKGAIERLEKKTATPKLF